jgi:Phytanoyl-CoA dioxygenase (PhyH)
MSPRLQRDTLRTHLGVGFTRIAFNLERDGIVILPDYLPDNTVERLQRTFARMVLGKMGRPFEALISISGPVDGPRLDAEPDLTELFSDPFLLALAADHLGSSPSLANWRAYRQFRRSPIRYRAWDWHTDQRLHEVKIMVLLSDVNKHGQPMQYAPGSHLAKLTADYQAGTKFSLDDAITLGDGRIIQATGRAGTAIVFNPNGLHRGTRSVAEARDVITYTLVPDRPGSPTFLASESGSTHRTFGSEPFDDEWQRLLRTCHHTISTRSERFSEARLGPFEIADVDDQLCTYADTPAYNDVKPRYMGEDSLLSFLADHPDIDFPADLNLPLHKGDADVCRDIQLVMLRDRASDDKGWRRFSELLLTVPPNTTSRTEFPASRHLEAVFSEVHSLCRAVRTRSSVPTAGSIDCMVAFLDDLASADFVSSAQLMRSTLAYAAATMTDLESAIAGPGASSTGPTKHELARETSQITSRLAELYVQAVAADEAAVKGRAE